MQKLCVGDRLSSRCYGLLEFDDICLPWDVVANLRNAVFNDQEIVYPYLLPKPWDCGEHFRSKKLPYDSWA